jgi:hypothetical protein
MPAGRRRFLSDAGFVEAGLDEIEGTRDRELLRLLLSEFFFHDDRCPPDLTQQK